jgi:hypothetical protein
LVRRFDCIIRTGELPHRNRLFAGSVTGSLLIVKTSTLLTAFGAD